MRKDSSSTLFQNPSRTTKSSRNRLTLPMNLPCVETGDQKHLPLHLQHSGVPPLKCQGIKTRLLSFIFSQIRWTPRSSSVWIEPFLGSGVVAFNLAPERAILADSNEHIIRFYQAIQRGEMGRESVRAFLTEEGGKLAAIGEAYYYQVRQRFNAEASPYDFLFLNRACFNGLMRFNSRGEFNVPFCRKPQRFSRSYITKIANQVAWVAGQMVGKSWEFRATSWQSVLSCARAQDFVYLDPPYIGRHTDYYNGWALSEAEQLALVSQSLPCGFAVSMWLGNQYRDNSHVHAWMPAEMRTCQHFYHVGSREVWRGKMVEALLIKPGFAVEETTNPAPL